MFKNKKNELCSAAQNILFDRFLSTIENARMLIGLFTFLLLVSLWVFSPVPAKADPVKAGNCGADGDNVTWVLDDKGVMTISGSGDMGTFDSSSTPWKSEKANIKKAIIEEGVTSVGAFAFETCHNLRDITIPDGITRIGDSAFISCDGLLRVDLPDSVNSIGGHAFAWCDNLMQITLPNGITTIEPCAFCYCTNLEKVTLPDNITNIGNMGFFHCHSLKKVKLPNSVVRINRNAFGGCRNLEELVLSDNLTEIGERAFSGCENLRKIVFLFPDRITNWGNSIFSLISQEYIIYTLSESYERFMLQPNQTTYHTNLFAPSHLKYLYGDDTNSTTTNYLEFALDRIVMTSDTSVTISDYMNTDIDIEECTVTVSDEDIFSYNNGILTALGEGNGSLSVSYGELSATVTLISKTNDVETTGIAFKDAVISLEKGRSKILNPLLSPENATDTAISWSSSDPSVVTVDNGRITAVETGTSVITASLDSNPEIMASCEVTVIIPLKAIVTLEEVDTYILKTGEPKKLRYYLCPSNATNVDLAFVSSNPEIVSIDENGMMTAWDNGTAQITIFSGDISKTVEVTAYIPLKRLSFDESAVSATCGDTVQLTPVYEPENTTERDVTWASDKENVATVDENGFVTVRGIGVAEITVRSGNRSATCSIVCNTHNWDEGNITTEPTCAEAGVKTYTCVCGETYTESIEADATRHVFVEEFTVEKEPSCQEEGLMYRQCAYCDAKTDVTVIPRRHVWKYMVCVKEPSCTEEGVQGLLCSLCGELDVDHLWAISKTEHIYSDWTVTKEASCTEDGNKEKVCSVCGDTVIEVISAMGHIWNKDYTVDKEATSTEEGSKSIHCSVCGESDESTIIVIPKTNQNEYTVELNSTITGNQISGQEYRFNFVVPKLGEVQVKYSASPDVSEGRLLSTLVSQQISASNIASASTAWNSVTGKVEYTITGYFPAGDGYFSFKNSGNGPYSIEIKFREVKETIQEIPVGSNNTIQTATPIVLSSSYYGLVSSCDKVDVYSIEADPGKYVVCVKGLKKSGGVGIDIYDDNGDIFFSDSRYYDTGWGESNLLQFDFECNKAGRAKYYVAINEKWGASPEYILSIQKYCDVHGHSWDEGKVTKAATCTTDGIKSYSCQNESTHTKTEVIPETGHKAGTAIKENEKAASCSADGSYDEVVYCTVCRAEISRQTVTVPKTGAHAWNEGEVTKHPTAEETGIKIYTCTVCGGTREEILSNEAEKTAAANQAAASAVISKINALPVSITTINKSAIDEARALYNTLTDEQKALVSDELKSKLESAETQLQKAEQVAAANQAAASAVISKINALPVSITTNNKSAIDEARALYNTLTDEQKALVSDELKSKLESAETQLQIAEQVEKANQAATNAAISKINALPASVTTDNKSAIEEARALYNALTDEQKALVSNEVKNKLEDAEARLVKAEKEKSIPKVGTKLTHPNSGLIYGVTKKGKEVSVKGITKKKKTVSIPKEVTLGGVKYKVTAIASSAFKGNKTIQEVSIGSKVTKIGEKAFYGCGNLKKVKGGSGVIKLNASIFYGCKKLTSITIGSKVTSIGSKAFAECASLKKIIIPSSVKSIGKEAFLNCKKLSAITIKTSKLTGNKVGQNAFKGTVAKLTVKVPKTVKKAYKVWLPKKGLSSKAKITQYN